MPISIPQEWVTLTQVIYALCSLSMVILAVNSALSIFHYLRARKAFDDLPQPPEPSEWPCVTVQLPIYNEQYVLEKLIQSITAMDYPIEKFEIQVLDDSTDSTAQFAQNLVERYHNQGFNILYIHRDNRQGYKAGALSEGLKTATGEFVAIFDADFIPQRDWLKRCVVHFDDPKIGFVQTRWTFLNREQNMVTRTASLTLDSHFLIEAVARSGNNLLLNFNGSAGMWRRQAIDSAGGWQSDTLVEDLDLSIRAYIAGWKGKYLKNVTASSEVPVQIDAYKNQQFRWVKGTVQVMRKMGWRLLRSELPLKLRIIMLMNMFAPSISFPFGVILQLIFLPIGLFSPWLIPWFGWTGVALVGPLLTFIMAKSEDLPRIGDRLRQIPSVFLVGAGISVNCAIAAIAGLFQMGGVFKRTPKFNPTSQNGHWAANHYAVKISPVVWAEIAVGAYILATLVVLWPVMGLILWPWSLVSSTGFFLVAGMSLSQEAARWHKQRQARQKTQAQADR